MDLQHILDRIAGGRTDAVIDLLARPDWRDALAAGPVRPLQWCVYYGDVTAVKAVLVAGGDLSSLDLHMELGHAAFFGHWRMCDLLIGHGADPRRAQADTGETPLHGAVSKAGRPDRLYTVRRLVEAGADVNARTIPGQDTGAFMRDARTKGETPLHRAAAFADAATLRYLLDHGADREARDACGDTPLAWASWHLRPASILQLLVFGPHRISDAQVARLVSDHGQGWGNGMDWNLTGDYLPDPPDH